MVNHLKTSITEWLAVYSLRLARRDGPLGKDLYNELGFYLTSIGIEAVTLRVSNQGQLEVYLTRRPVDDAYSLQWHCPGSILRRREYIENVMERLAQREFKAPIYSFNYVDEFFHQEQRGWFLMKVYVVEVDGVTEGADRKWFPVDDLPPHIVAHHAQEIIPRAVQYYYQHCSMEERLL
jgi:hypothetical protein